MTITVYGVVGNLSVASFGQMQYLALRGGGPEYVSGCAVSVATGTRLVTVASGTGYAPGLMFNSDAQNVTLDANSSGKTRIDTIVMQLDMTGSATTAGTLTKVNGSPANNPIPATITRTQGALWQIPLAYVTVVNGVGQLGGGTVENCSPSRRVELPYTDAVDTSIGSGGNGLAHDASATKVAEVTIADPGWNYRLRYEGCVNFNGTDSGKGRCFAYYDDGSGDTLVTNGESGALCAAPAVIVPTLSGILTRSVIARLYVAPNSMNSPDKLKPGSFGSSFTVTVVPA